MDISYVCGVITIFILIVLVICFYHFNKIKSELIFKVVECDLVEKDIFDHKTPYSKTKIPTGPRGRIIGHGDAIAIYGEIPTEKFYWGISSFRTNSYPRIFSDTVSGNKIQNLISGDGVAVILLSNPYMLEHIKKCLSKEWSNNKPLNFYPIYTKGPGSWNLCLEYLELGYNNLDNEKFKCKVFHSPNIPIKDSPFQSKIIRDLAPKEEDILPKKTWEESLYKTAFIKGYKIKREIKTTHLTGNGRDFISFVTNEFTVNDDEFVLIVAIDHVATDRSIYSSVSFESNNVSYGFYLTGNLKKRVRNIGNNTRAHVLIHKPGTKDENTFRDISKNVSIRIIEKIGPESISGIAPGKTSIIPMRVLIVQKN